jgi:hypothetical protein
MHGFLQEQRNTEAMTDRRDVNAQGFCSAFATTECARGDENTALTEI